MCFFLFLVTYTQQKVTRNSLRLERVKIVRSNVIPKTLTKNDNNKKNYIDTKKHHKKKRITSREAKRKSEKERQKV